MVKRARSSACDIEAADPPTPLALATTTVAPSVTIVVVVDAGAVDGSDDGAVVAASLLPSLAAAPVPADSRSNCFFSSPLIERRMKKPATTAIRARPIDKPPLTGAPPSAERGVRRGTGPDPSPASLILER